MTDNDSDRWGELERLAREATPGPWRAHHYTVCDTGRPDDPIATDTVDRATAAYIAAAHPQAILDLVGALRTAEGRVATCSRPVRDTVSAYEVMLEECEAMEAERDALRAYVNGDTYDLGQLKSALLGGGPPTAFERLSTERDALRAEVERLRARQCKHCEDVGCTHEEEQPPRCACCGDNLD